MKFWKKTCTACITAVLCFTSIASFPWSVSAASYAMGDMDNDGIVSIDDAFTILSAYSRQAAGSAIPLTEEQIAAADIDADGNITIDDAFYALSYYSKHAAGREVTWNEVVYESLLPTPKLSLVNKGTTISVNWTGNANADGYEVYRNGELLRNIPVSTLTNLNDTDLDSDTEYYYQVRSYIYRDAQTVYSDFSETKFSDEPEAILNSVSLNPHNTFVCYDHSDGKTGNDILYSFTLTSADKATLAAFAKKHFTAGMTREEQLWTTLEWIHYNVDYAYVGAKWNAIANKTLVDAIFNYKSGQCLQYNGAMCAMLVYLGYDAHMEFQRDSSTGWQHFLCWVTINGKNYRMETGNYGKNGDWMYFMAPE